MAVDGEDEVEEDTWVVVEEAIWAVDAVAMVEDVEDMDAVAMDEAEEVGGTLVATKFSLCSCAATINVHIVLS